MTTFSDDLSPGGCDAVSGHCARVRNPSLGLRGGARLDERDRGVLSAYLCPGHGPRESAASSSSPGPVRP